MPLTVTDTERQELAVTYAALILSDEQQLAVSAENLNKLLQASHVSVQPYYPKLFARILEGKDVTDVLLHWKFPSTAPSTANPAQAVVDSAPDAGDSDTDCDTDCDCGGSDFDLDIFAL